MEPDLQTLAQNSGWSVGQWSDGWLLTRSEFPPHQIEEAWKAVVAISRAMHVSPDDAARALIKVRMDLAF